MLGYFPQQIRVCVLRLYIPSGDQGDVTLEVVGEVPSALPRTAHAVRRRGAPPGGAHYDGSAGVERGGQREDACSPRVQERVQGRATLELGFGIDITRT
eukprot:538626-Pyramimonas_sp.AAC.1